jgi:hypothetical protein
MENVFLTAARNKFRFDTNKGSLSTEQLWDLPLQSTSATAVTLDGIAQNLNRQVKALAEESFVTPRTASPKDELAQKLEVVKAIIAVKLEERTAAEQARERAQKKVQLTELLARKNEQKLESLSEEDLLKQLAELG